MSVMPSSSASSNLWPTIFVTGPVPHQEPPPVNGTCNRQLALELTHALDHDSDPQVLANFMEKYPNFYLDTAGRTNWTALLVAISKNAIPLIRAILDRNPRLADKTYMVNVGSTGSVAMAKVFLQYTQNINQCASEGLGMAGVTPLHRSLEGGHDELTKFLLLRGGVVYEQARQTLLDSSSLIDRNWIAEVKDQPIYANRMIQAIKREYLSSGSELAGGLHTSNSMSCFSKLPQEVGSLIARFVNGEIELRHRFLVQLKLVRD